VFTSDNVYLYENFDKHVPIAQTVGGDDGKASNLRAQDRAKSLASNPKLIVPATTPPSSTASSRWRLASSASAECWGLPW
jgi:hypothetical protein